MARAKGDRVGGLRSFLEPPARAKLEALVKKASQRKIEGMPRDLGCLSGRFLQSLGRNCSAAKSLHRASGGFMDSCSSLDPSYFSM